MKKILIPLRKAGDTTILNKFLEKFRKWCVSTAPGLIRRLISELMKRSDLLNNKDGGKIKAAVCILLCTLLLICSFACSVGESDESAAVSDAQQTTAQEVIISDEVESLAEDTSKAVEQGKDIATDEVIESGLDKEKELEPDAVVEQENVSYDGTATGDGMSLLGAYSGLTYYNQADSRWANVLYTSTGNRTQTMASSACGPTAAAMVVSSSKGAILPTTMANLFVDNGYRTANNGTAWAAFQFTADYFGFNEYHTTTSFSTMLKYLKKGYFVIVSCNSGLWTTGGHYVVLVADNGGTITVYDPYLYSGKFNTASRRAANVRVSGNAAYVSETNFKKYSNAVQYWIFSNDSGKGGSAAKPAPSKNVNYTRYVSTQSAPLNVRTGAGTGYSIKSTLKKGTKVTVKKTSGTWSYISSPVTGWVSTEYLSSAKVSETASAPAKSYKTTVGSYYRLKKATTLYSKSNLSGTKYQYLAKTQIKVLSHISATVDYIYVVKTGRYAYCPVSAYADVSASAPAVKTGTYTLKEVCGVYKRSSNGVFTRKKVSQLTANGRQNATSKSASANAYLKKGTKVTVSSTVKDKDGNLWAKIPSGYILVWHYNIGTLRIK